MDKNNNAFCFLGGIIFDDIKGEFEANCKHTPQYAVETFQRALIRGISENFGPLDVVNLPFIGAWPLNYRKLRSPRSCVGQVEEGSAVYNIRNVSFCNALLLKFWFRERSAFKALKTYLEENRGKANVYVFVYSVHLPFLRALRRLKRKFDNLRVITIVPDLPQYKNDILPWYKSWIMNYDTHATDADYNVADAFLLLSSHMRDVVVRNGQPSTVVEGIFSQNPSATEAQAEGTKSLTKDIFYSGTLARRYNIMNLVDAFQSIPRDDIRLIICGDGSCRDEIVERAKSDPRIVFKGALPHDEVLSLQRESFLLVNPRTPEGDFTKYSFPSKTMEYLASGTPTLLYRLDGIPDEYYDYCFSLTDNSVDALAAKLSEIILTPEAELRALGAKARQFVLDKKNPAAQCSKIRELLHEIPN